MSNGDDGIAVKSGLNEAGRRFNRPAENILVEHCHFTFGDGLSVGSEISGGVRNVTFRHNTLRLSSSTTYLKTSPSRGAFIRDVRFENINSDAKEVIRLRTVYDKSPPAPHPTIIDNITWINVDADAVRAGRLECSQLIPCTNLHFENVQVTSVLGYECSKFLSGTQHKTFPKICL